MAINGVEIKLGQVWEDGQGTLVEITEITGNDRFPFGSRDGYSYRGDGQFLPGCISGFDLVRLVAASSSQANAETSGELDLSRLLKILASIESATSGAALNACKPDEAGPAGDSTMASTSSGLSMLMGAHHAGIGDINSDAKGSGARFNSGKVPYELVPIELMARYWDQVFDGGLYDDEEFRIVSVVGVAQALWAVGEFQARRSEACLIDVLLALGDGWEDCARVFDYGQKKYAAWNWSKGMAWSIPLACATRHLIAMLNGEEIDIDKMVDGVLVEGSNLPHRGHVYCNICMLLTYEETFIEGDDRPVDGALADNETYL